MDNVRILKRHLKKFIYSYTTNDGYVDGILVPGVKIEENIKAAPFPVDANILKMFPDGNINYNDIVLYTKNTLNNVNGKIKRVKNNEEFTIFERVSYLEVADLKVYICKRVGENG